MKKQHCRKTAFSLAEALITLLIISIIAIASMPVITKKKRQVTENGKWMCTLNSNYDYVEWDSKNDSADIVNNPDSWRVVSGTKYTDTISYTDPVTGNWRQKKRDKCVFYPPSGARNFNVTVVGGGGAGHDGDAVYKSYYSKSSAGSGTFIPKSEYNDVYDIILIGAGGGGGGGQNNGGSGGGGGGGAMFKGSVQLVNNATYSFNIGSGGAGGSGEYHGGLSKKTSSTPGKDGGESTFDGSANGKSVSIKVPGGKGAGSVGCSKWKCRGGGAGVGGSTGDLKTTFSSTATGSISKQNGASGKSGDQYSCPADISGGINKFKSFQEDSNKNPYTLSGGSGGRGGKGCGNSYGGTTGSVGYISISQTEQIHGQGGSAGKIDSKFVPSIEGHIVADIPAPAEPNQNGASVAAELYNNKTENGVIKRAAGGAKGGTSYENPTDGEHSPWTYDGGGTASGKCSNITDASAGTITEYQKILKCEKAACVLDTADTIYLKEKNLSAGGLAVAPLGITASWAVDNSAAAYAELLPSSSKAAAVKTYLELLKIYYITAEEAVNKININNEYMSSYSNSYDFYNKGCFDDGDRLSYAKECLTEKYETKAVEKQVEARRTQTCPNASNGASFGAGGGGGRAGELQAVYGRGGHGAPGAVIVEW